jgi:hypothetical protein
MSLDQLDTAFVHRLAVRPRVRPAERPERPRPAPRSEAAPIPPAPAAIAPRRFQPPAPVAPSAPLPAPVARIASPPVPPADPVVARLLARAPREWDALAGHVEAARMRGRRVIAVAGGRAGEGRSTLVACLAATLRGRGREVACARPDELAVVAGGPDGRGPTHDKRIVLCDAGIWFPPGPIRRSLLQVASLGCEAAILVRRADASGGPARQAALEALGIEVLGEVLTFTGPLIADELQDGGAAA